MVAPEAWVAKGVAAAAPVAAEHEGVACANRGSEEESVGPAEAVAKAKATRVADAAAEAGVAAGGRAATAASPARRRQQRLALASVKAAVEEEAAVVVASCWPARFVRARAALCLRSVRSLQPERRGTPAREESRCAAAQATMASWHQDPAARSSPPPLPPQPRPPPPLARSPRWPFSSYAYRRPHGRRALGQKPSSITGAQLFTVVIIPLTDILRVLGRWL